jgi:uncharacterized repeat protein (TIGR03803 family)
MSALEQPRSRIFAIHSQAASMLALTLALAAMFSVTQAASAQTLHLFYQFKSGNDGSQPYANVILDPQGNLYGTTTIDGAYGYGTVFKVSPTGKETVLHSFTGKGGDGAFPVSPLVRDSAGNLYGTTELGGVFGGACGVNGCGTVFKIDPTGKETVLHRFAGYPIDGQNPWQGLVLDPAGNLYGTTFQGGAHFWGTVFKLHPTGKETVLHSFNLANGDGIAPLDGSLLRDSAGNLYGTTLAGGSLGAGTVFKVDSRGNETILYSFGFSNGDGFEPSGTLAKDSAGNLYGATLFGGAFNFGTIFKVDTTGSESILHSFSATGGDGAVPGGGLLLDHAGNLYGTTESGGSSYCGTIFKLDSGGTETILYSFSGADGRLPELGLVRDSKGSFYGTAQYGGKFGGGVVFKLIP